MLVELYQARPYRGCTSHSRRISRCRCNLSYYGKQSAKLHL